MSRLLRPSPLNRQARVRLAGAFLVLAAGAAPPLLAQQEFSGDMVGAPPLLADVNAELVVTAFEQACVLSAGRAQEAIEWAMANDFESSDAARLAGGSALNGELGTVLIAPQTDGRVMLAVSASQCSVWAERTSGPPLRAALLTMIEALSVKGHTASVLSDRSAERAGAWRHQLQWRFRAAGSTTDWNLGAVTTLGNGQGTQVLHFAPGSSKPAPGASSGVVSPPPPAEQGLHRAP